MQLEHRHVPGEVAMERRAPVVSAHPLLEEGGPHLRVQRLEGDVGKVMDGVGIVRILPQRALGEPP